METPLLRHLRSWWNCQRCELWEQRHKMVFARGNVPCDILFVGEAPGESEDLLGRPFVGPAGKLLDQIIAIAIPDKLSYALTNLVCCIPRDPRDNSKVHEPPYDAVIACKPRLEQFAKIAHPKLVIAVGKCAADWMNRKLKGSVEISKKARIVEILHPAAILRMSVAQQGLATQRTIVVISTAVQEVFA